MAWLLYYMLVGIFNYFLLVASEQCFALYLGVFWQLNELHT